jgi:hypothetical protein
LCEEFVEEKVEEYGAEIEVVSPLENEIGPANVEEPFAELHFVKVDRSYD